MTDTAFHIPDGAAGPELDVRTRVVTEAERLFRDIGYQKTTVADIARALKMSPANVYRFFDSKKAINEAVAIRVMGEIEDALSAVANGPGSARQRLRAFLLANHAMSAELFTGDVKLHEMVEVAMSESWAAIKAHVDRVREMVERMIADGCAAGEFTTPDTHVASHCVMTAWVRFCHPQLIAQFVEKPEPTREQMVEFVLAAIENRPAPAR
ncbi:TetR/AcrR family transcriptional regulator [Chelatococcus reniformis]|uniref:TetR/AcrR family transcriptional regulator n=1 Tax=Chelatococcus reniformis TaxID=1494448 RepID=UPI001FCE58E4|nr:TetR family transcriptional regulator [Chelatococcus reniformis]